MNKFILTTLVSITLSLPAYPDCDKFNGQEKKNCSTVKYWTQLCSESLCPDCGSFHTDDNGVVQYEASFCEEQYKRKRDSDDIKRKYQ